MHEARTFCEAAHFDRRENKLRQKGASHFTIFFKKQQKYLFFYYFCKKEKHEN